ncbi:hypothetical protein L3Q72_00890 [Vibrio sp. JC009]|uniref:hypothetical protein n=1 Tax=Vibrio sp. JC009 TaxID=2912314 RepID=UPI0023AF6100|nr:hypothetical protein [Vibrio sp. JC009]WED22004.1 hypothetical protein L3Q72_00890 [Vibrio sp. JC009]
MMIEVVSLVNFDNQDRSRYLRESFGSFYHYNDVDIRHIVFDSSQRVGRQKEYYDKYDIELVHAPGTSYSQRLKMIESKVTNDYFLFHPDDFRWICPYPLADVINNCRKHNIDQIKMVCRGMEWFSSQNPAPKPWYEGNQVVTGEKLEECDDLFISRRQWRRDFHEQFSLSCTISRTEFFTKLCGRLSDNIFSPGQAEKHAYVRLFFQRYLTAYYKMRIPVFHFAEYDIEGDRTLKDMLIKDNFSLYNKLYNNK